jgi:hypothetical protein
MLAAGYRVAYYSVIARSSRGASLWGVVERKVLRKQMGLISPL